MANAESFNRMFLSRIHILLIVLHWLRDRRKSLQDKFIHIVSAQCLASGLFLYASILCSILVLPSASFADVPNSTPNAVGNAVEGTVEVMPSADAGISSDLLEPDVLDPAITTQDKLPQFAKAYVEVLTLLSDREPELSAAETSDEAAKVQTAIEADAVALIEQNGLTMTEYMQILAQASQDETFRDEVLSGIDAALQE